MPIAQCHLQFGTTVARDNNDTNHAIEKPYKFPPLGGTF